MMNIDYKYQSFGGILLLALTLAACGPAGTSSQAPTLTAAATAAPTAQPSAAPAPTDAPTSTPMPTAAPTEAPIAQPAPTAWPDAILPTDVPWVRNGNIVFGDDETLEFQQRGLPIPAYHLSVAPGGAYLAYVGQDDRLAIVDMRTELSLIGADESIGQPIGMAFSPDSRTLALTLLDQSNTWRLQQRDLESGTMRTLTEGPIHASTPNDPLPLLPRPVAWTPAGLFVEDVLWATDAPARNVALVNPADGSRRVLREDAHVGVYPSHNGAKVAVVTGALLMGEPPTTGIEILDVASGQRQEILPVQQQLVRKITWSHDDQKLLYALSADYQAPSTSIHARNPDGTGEQQIEIGATGSKAVYGDIAWLNSQAALVLSPEADGYAHVYTLPLDAFDSTGLQPLAAFQYDQSSQAPLEVIYTPGQ
jgi:WD40 repeat protein